MSCCKSHPGGRASVRRFLVGAALTLWIALPGAHLTATAAAGPSPQVSVLEVRGTYSVVARFEVPQDTGAAVAVLSDYEQIPRFMPDVRTSVILERTPGRILVEQEAVSQFMMFSKKVHLILEVTETGNSIHFVDRCGTSFTRYEGTWRVLPEGNGARVTYQLTARPAFDVPEFILKRLLKRNSGQMIDRLRREIAARAEPVVDPPPVRAK